MRIIKTQDYRLETNLNLFKEDTIETRVKAILNDVILRKDLACIEATQRFDKVSMKSFKMDLKIMKKRFEEADPQLIEALKLAKSRIEAYHIHQLEQSWEVSDEDGVRYGQKITPIQRVGVYVPGGKASYPSTVLMNVIPAQLAKVEEIVIVSAPNEFGEVAQSVSVAAYLCGIEEVYAIGGAQAIGALAFGTEEIKKVDKIVGPGNAYVAKAKQLVFGHVGIDMIAGPSEVLIVVDDSAKPSWIAADMLAQLEHDTMASAIVLSQSEDVLKKVQIEFEIQLKSLPRQEILSESKNNAIGLLASSFEDLVEMINTCASEHCELHVSEPYELLKSVKHAGSIFIGDTSAEVFGDYCAGVNHTLPTSRTARFASALGVYDFVKRSATLYYPEDVMRKHAPVVNTIANEEGLIAHAKAAMIRLKEDNNE
ncbi:MAG: histidinol dehydrogenase [Erysipelothrix sp.]|jgi:histidinol dehydrogenase|nr:histidinol dehydrogenase [Erysipelothrix sp.]